jgi:penicillin-binding protein 1A
MRDRFITEEQYQKALRNPAHQPQGQDFDVHAEYVAELARQVVYAQFKEDSYTKGISVYTTILKADQKAAYESMRRNVLNYDQRHGYRGPEAFITLPAGEEERDDAIEARCKNVRQRRPDSGRGAGGQPESVKVQNPSGDEITISGDGLRLVANALSDKAKDAVRLRPGAVIRIMQEKRRWIVTQCRRYRRRLCRSIRSPAATTPWSAASITTCRSSTTSRRPGASPVPRSSPSCIRRRWKRLLAGHHHQRRAARPDRRRNRQRSLVAENDDGKFDGPITMRTALAESKNVASVRILRAITVPYAHATWANSASTWPSIRRT